MVLNDMKSITGHSKNMISIMIKYEYVSKKCHLHITSKVKY